jgi:hypothetical protein
MKTRTTAMNVEFSEHFSQECDAWLRELDFLLLEVSFLKTRLSHAVDATSSRVKVAEAESFQNGFISTEEMVRRLLAEVKFQNEQISYSKKLEDPQQERKIRTGQEYLRAAITKLEAELSETRKQFNQWVLANIRTD